MCKPAHAFIDKKHSYVGALLCLECTRGTVGMVTELFGGSLYELFGLFSYIVMIVKRLADGCNGNAALLSNILHRYHEFKTP